MKKGARPDPVREKDEGFEPLYWQVARWGLSLGRPFTPEELAETFGLPLQKASSLIYYICKLGADKVRVRKTYRRGATPMKKQVLGSVEIVSVAQARPAGHRTSRKRAPAPVPVTLGDLWHSLRRASGKAAHETQEEKGGDDEG